MKELFDGQYKAIKRTRKSGSIEYTELLFLDHRIPLKVVEEVEADPTLYISNTEDRNVEITLLGEKFKARIIRPEGNWFYGGTQSFGAEIASLLYAYFGIPVFRCDPYRFRDKPEWEKPRPAFKTFPNNEYCYLPDKDSRSTEDRVIGHDSLCPIYKGQRIFKEDLLYVSKECFFCPYHGKMTKDREGLPVFGCFYPKLEWPE